MIADWQTFLISKNAIVEGGLDTGLVSNYGDPAQEIKAANSQNIITDLSHLGLIAIHGDDAETFLQGQFTNDVSLVKPEVSQLSGYCNPKGRLLALFRLFRTNDAYFMQMPKAIIVPTLKRLQMFVLMSKVTLEDVSQEYVQIGISISPDKEELAETLLVLPQDTNQVTQATDSTIIRVPGAKRRYEIIARPEAMIKLWQKLSNHFTPVGTAQWKLLDILSGIPNIVAQTTDTFIPQMLNLETLDGISFIKGCYTGQEIVARLHYRGKLKRRMHLAHLDTDELPKPGDNLYVSESESNEEAGTIVAAQTSANGGVDLLAVVRTPFAETANISLYIDKGPYLQITNLPYQDRLTDNN